VPVAAERALTVSKPPPHLEEHEHPGEEPQREQDASDHGIHAPRSKARTAKSLQCGLLRVAWGET